MTSTPQRRVHSTIHALPDGYDAHRVTITDTPYGVVICDPYMPALVVRDGKFIPYTCEENRLLPKGRILAKQVFSDGSVLLRLPEYETDEKPGLWRRLITFLRARARISRQ